MTRTTYTLSGVVSEATPTSLAPLEGVQVIFNGRRRTDTRFDVQLVRR